MIGRCLGSLAFGFDDDQPVLGLCQKSGWRGSIRTGKIRSGDVWPLNHKSCGVVGAVRFHAQLQGVGKGSRYRRRMPRAFERDLGALSCLLVVSQDVLVSNFKWIVVSNFKLSRCHNCRCIRIDGVLWCVMSNF